MSAIGSSTGFVGSTEVQIAWAVEKKARRVAQEQGDAAVQLIKEAAAVAEASRHATGRDNGLGGRLDLRG